MEGKQNWCKVKTKRKQDGGRRWGGASRQRPWGESSPMLVRVWASSELMEPTGCTANLSWNHLSGLANLPRLLSLYFLPPPHPTHTFPRHIHKAWRYHEVTVGTEGYFVPSWFEECWAVSAGVRRSDIVWPLTSVHVEPSVLHHAVFNGKWN